MSLDLTALKTAGVIGITYFLIRILGKYGGMYLGCVLTKMPASHRNYMGLALIPQAGVAIGLAFLGQRLLPAEIGNLLLTIILSSSVLYELVGPCLLYTSVGSVKCFDFFLCHFFQVGGVVEIYYCFIRTCGSF